MLQEYIQFLSELNENNSKQWFDINRPRYKELNEKFQIFVGEIIIEIGKYDKTIKYLTPKDCTFRIKPKPVLVSIKAAKALTLLVIISR
jgi:uncharacterized protein (DUF2461 family)